MTFDISLLQLTHQPIDLIAHCRVRFFTRVTRIGESVLAREYWQVSVGEHELDRVIRLKHCINGWYQAFRNLCYSDDNSQ